MATIRLTMSLGPHPATINQIIGQKSGYNWRLIKEMNGEHHSCDSSKQRGFYMLDQEQQNFLERDGQKST